jgi:hypothetical protein
MALVQKVQVKRNLKLGRGFTAYLGKATLHKGYDWLDIYCYFRRLKMYRASLLFIVCIIFLGCEILTPHNPEKVIKKGVEYLKEGDTKKYSELVVNYPYKDNVPIAVINKHKEEKIKRWKDFDIKIIDRFGVSADNIVYRNKNTWKMETHGYSIGFKADEPNTSLKQCPDGYQCFQSAVSLSVEIINKNSKVTKKFIIPFLEFEGQWYIWNEKRHSEGPVCKYFDLCQ